jgi:hypothetical protein
MIGQRTRHSLAQLLEQQPAANVDTLIAKHGGNISIGRGSEMHDILYAVRGLADHQVMAVLAEVVATTGDLRHRVTPKYRFEERERDLTQCLALDGYQVEDKRLSQTDPSIADAAPIDDDLVDALRTCGAPHSADIIQKIEDSAQAFRMSPADYNASLVNARVALETLAGDIALDVATAAKAIPLPFDPSKWGTMVTYLRMSGAISLEEERGLVGVYALLSAGAHRPMALGISEAQMTRLGRAFALNMCWFLLQNHLARRGI